MGKTTQLYEALSEEQKKFVQSKKIEANYKVKAWLEFLKNVAIMDKHGDKLRSSLSGWRIAFIVFAVIFGFIGFAFPPLFVMVIILIGLIIWFSTMISNLKKMDLNNNLRLFAVPLLVVLKEETRDENKLFMKLNMSDPLSKDFLKQNIPNSNSSYPKIVTNIYSISWMEACIEMADGVTVQWTIDDLIRERKITKRNYRGKIKSKTKYKIKHDIDMKINVPKNVYNISGGVDNNYTDGGNFHIFKLKGRTISTNVDESIDINYFLGMMSSVYQKLKQVN